MEKQKSTKQVHADGGVKLSRKAEYHMFYLAQIQDSKLINFNHLE
jgi:hypothetical protein